MSELNVAIINVYNQPVCCRFNKFKVFISVFIVCSLIYLFQLYLINYQRINSIQYIQKNNLFKIDEINLIYRIFGETPKIPISIFLSDYYNEIPIFIFEDVIFADTESEVKDFLINKSIDSKLTTYFIYFNKQYDYDLHKFTVVPDEISLNKLKKRKNILQQIGIFDDINDFNIKFKKLNKYKYVTISKEQFETIISNNENKDIVLKFFAFSLFRMGNYDEAKIIYNKYLEKYPKDQDVLDIIKKINSL